MYINHLIVELLKYLHNSGISNNLKAIAKSYAITKNGQTPETSAEIFQNGFYPGEPVTDDLMQ